MVAIDVPSGCTSRTWQNTITFHLSSPALITLGSSVDCVSKVKRAFADGVTYSLLCSFPWWQGSLSVQS